MFTHIYMCTYIYIYDNVYLSEQLHKISLTVDVRKFTAVDAISVLYHIPFYGNIMQEKIVFYIPHVGPCLKQLQAGLLQRTPGFNPRPS